MSGSGKSSWSTNLVEAGFTRFCCDDLIAEKIYSDLMGPDGTVRELGEWMGFPYESHYKRRESRYLSCEIEVLQEILEHLENRENNSEQNIVVDTTGSVIYTGEENLKRLRRTTTIVYLSTPAEIKEQMLNAYLDNMRPVLWRNLLRNRPNETNEEALARCYPELMSSRQKLYERYADVTIDYYTLNREDFGVRDLLDAVSTIHTEGPKRLTDN